MHLVTAIVLCCALLCSADRDTINHDQVRPFAQPDPVTISEKAAVKYKPQLSLLHGCASFPAVNAAGEITGGLKGTRDIEGCEKAPLGSQMYGRSAWYQDKWAIMYAWYFPKNFCQYRAKKRHDWASMVLWIDNPAVETPKILGVSLSQQTLTTPKRFLLSRPERYEEPYQKTTELHRMNFVGTEQVKHTQLSRWQWNYTYEGGSNISMRVSHEFPDTFGWVALRFAYKDGVYHSLIMWEQLTNAAREALNTADFGEAMVPFNQNNFETMLRKAWPF
ncbi:Necrosis inducing protein NPP1 [Phytophthora megakarya]|uniref:Necrosis inducing protein NPP1 n=1 Tax=Phytophthora megakarya TaxID=4795 RepID=A0A225W7Y1_9STRA|nr:Necrosis inducing protein NPP1 [Phytophthora megakarya]